MDYSEFLRHKQHLAPPVPRELHYTPSKLFKFQSYLVSLALNNTRFGIFADVGMGKTIMQLTWAKNVSIATGKPVMVLAPLAVTFQTEQEAIKFDIDGVAVSRNGEIRSQVVITNYEQLHKFNPLDFGGCVCDESGILKSFDGQIRNAIINFMKRVEYRLICSATPAPNDFIELGSSSEALGIMGQTSMLQKFFRNYRDNCSNRRHFGETPKWQFRGHSEIPFWRWVSTWARAVKKPSDIGFDDTGYDLPELMVNHHKIDVEPPDGMLFSLPCTTLAEQREESKRTIPDRCYYAAQLTKDTGKPYIAWCNRNEEASTLKKMLPDAVEISGADSDDSKLDKFQAFLKGDARGLITKPKIGAWGLNFQHCAHMAYFPNHSYEQWYQCVGRCHRYGQKSKVVVDVIFSPGEQRILDNMIQKSKKADQMYSQLIEQMNSPLTVAKRTVNTTYELPGWIS